MQSPRSTPARGGVGRPVGREGGHGGVEHAAEVLGGRGRVVDDGSHEREVAHVDDRLDAARRQGVAPAGIVALVVAEPLEEQSGGVAGTGERHPGLRAVGGADTEGQRPARARRRRRRPARRPSASRRRSVRGIGARATWRRAARRSRWSCHRSRSCRRAARCLVWTPRCRAARDSRRASAAAEHVLVAGAHGGGVEHPPHPSRHATGAPDRSPRQCHQDRRARGHHVSGSV